VNHDGGRSAPTRPHPARDAAITPRLAEILARMVEAALDAEDAAGTTRGTVATRRSPAPRDRRPDAA
jgi:hypothetical protein